MVPDALDRVQLLDEIRRARAAAEQEYRRFDTLLSSIQDFVYLFDRSGRFTYVNQALLDLWGIELKDAVGKNFAELGYPAELSALHEQQLDHVLRTGEAIRSENPYQLRTGEVRHYEYIFTPILEDGEVSAIAGVTRDITDRRRVDEERRFLSEASRILVSNIEYEEVLRRAADLAVPFLAELCLIDVLEEGRFRRVIARSGDVPEEAEWARKLELYPPRPQSMHPLIEVVRTGRPQIVAVEQDAVRDAIATDAEHRRIIDAVDPRSAMVVPLVSDDRPLGAIQFVGIAPRPAYEPRDLALAEDLAGRVAAAVQNARLYKAVDEARGEAERRAAQEEALREATAAVAAAFTVEEMSQRIAQNALRATRADGAFVKRIDATTDELEVVAAAGEQVPPVGMRTPYRGSMTERVVESGEPELIAEVGSLQPPLAGGLSEICGDCSAAVIPLLDAGEPIGSLFLLRLPEKWGFRADEVERAYVFGTLASLAFHKVHLFEESERRREELQAVTESRSRLMRGFSHDVKNPLGAADGFLQLLQDGIMGELTGEQQHAVARARRAIHGGLSLIDDLLELARTEAGQMEIRLAPTDVREATRDIAGEYLAQAEAKGLDMSVELPDEMPIIESDPARIRQILSNLLSNAVKYTETGSITVRVRTVQDQPRSGRTATPRPALAVDVEDTGPGIPEDKQRLLFKEFTRLRPEEAHGAGVGLSIARRLAHALRGDISVRSSSGKGSTFTLWLPLPPEE